MTFFDNRLMDLYFIAFFSVAAIAVALVLAVGITELMRRRA